jgi:hypothetical protein
MFELFLFLHIGAAIVAFGPTFAFPLIGAMGGREPMFANFATRVSAALERRMVIPLALTMPLSGTGLLWFAPSTSDGPIDIFASSGHWLLLAIAVYVFAISFVVFVQDRRVHKVIALTSRPPGPPAGGPPAGGPPPELMLAVKKVQQGGIVLSVALVIIFSLMIFRPGS